MVHSVIFLFSLVIGCTYGNHNIVKDPQDKEVLKLAKDFIVKENLLKDIIFPKAAVRVRELKEIELPRNLRKEDWVIFCHFKNNPIDLYRAYIVVVDSFSKGVKYNSYCYKSGWTWKWTCKNK